MIIPDKDFFPVSNVLIPYKNELLNVNLVKYWQASKEKYFTEGGIRVISLDELTVTASNKLKSAENSFYDGADDKITAETLDHFNGMSILNYLHTLSGISVKGQSVSIRGSSGSPLILIDGFETDDVNYISFRTTNDIEDIAIFKGPSAAIFGSKGGDGAIAISLKREVKFKTSKPISLAILKPLGFQKPSSFYMPKYVVAQDFNSSKKDLRTTLYWSGNLKSDNNGDVFIRVFTADFPNNYQFIF